jgi:hypothetical protein
LSALPATAESLCAFLADQATLGRRASTLGRRLAAVRYFHRTAGYETRTSDEKVKTVLSGIRRTIGAAPVRKRAATADIVIAMSPTATSLRALRNRATHCFFRAPLICHGCNPTAIMRSSTGNLATNPNTNAVGLRDSAERPSDHTHSRTHPFHPISWDRFRGSA